MHLCPAALGLVSDHYWLVDPQFRGRSGVRPAGSASYFSVASYNDFTSNEVNYYCMKKGEKRVLAILANTSL